MKIEGSKVMVLGAYGEVGMAVCKLILKQRPNTLYVLSQKKEEVEEVVEALSSSACESSQIVPLFGNLFVRSELKEKTLAEIASKKEDLISILEDTFYDLDHLTLSSSTLFRFIVDFRPDIVIDCINTASVLAYRNIYACYQEIFHYGRDEKIYEVFLASGLPLLIRHVQILYEALKAANVKVYVKVGTTGTGGQGFNIPFTHGEEFPSRLLLMKAALAGAHSMLLYIMSKTPNSPIIREIKPATMIAWKRIGKGEILKEGKPVKIYDFSPKKIFVLEEGKTFSLKDKDPDEPENSGSLKGTFIDTGENGLFSIHEFKVVSASGLMEFVTPEEVAKAVLDSILGFPKAIDVITGIDSSIISSSYKAGYLREYAIKTMLELGDEGVSYGLLGPRVSKLLFEAAILRSTCNSVEEALRKEPSLLAKEAENFVLQKDNPIRKEALSIGIPILLSDGRTFIFVNREKKDKDWELMPWLINQERIDHFAEREWIDLREKNMSRWQERMKIFLSKKDQRQKETRIDPGDLTAFVLIYEFGGGRAECY